MQDMRKRKRVGSLAEGPADAIVPPSYRPAPATFIPPSTVSSSSSPSFQHDSTSSPCSPSPSYHLPQFLAASPCLDDASPSWSHNNRGAEFNAARPSDRHLTALSEENLVSQSPSLTLSCGESSLNTTMTEDDRYTSAAGDETPNGQSDASLSESSTYWGGEESAEAFSESPASLLSSSLSSLSTSSTLLEDLSALGTVLSDEIYLEERRKELTSPTIEIGQEYHKTRPIVVDWMLDVGDYFSFHGATTHLAVAYLDRMLSLMVIERNKLQLVATACLLIAAKVEEVPNKVPTVPEFNERTLNTYTPELIRTCERVVLNHLEWSLIVTTPRSMLDFFLAEISCISYDDLIHGVPLSYARSREVEDWAVTTAHTVMTMIVLDHQFLRFQPSILAAVCLAVARRQARIEPLWPQRMERKTGYTFNEISECFHFTWAKQEIALANQAMEGQWGT